MTVAIVLSCTAVLLALAPLAVVIGRRPGAHYVVYGVSLAASLIALVAALHELVEWRAAVQAVPAGEGLAYLGGQGDVWDAQWDMFLALVGAAVALPLGARSHDRSMARVPPVGR